MNNNNTFSLIIIAACLTAGFISGFVLKSAACSDTPSVQVRGDIIKIHDTIKTPVITYKIIPGQSLNVDSLITVVNQFWKDSLKTLYGKGKFEAEFIKEDTRGKSEYKLESRIPIDPEANLIIDQQLSLPSVYPKRTFGLTAGIGYIPGYNIAATLGAKYYILDYKYFTLSAHAEGDYILNTKQWTPCITLQSELRF